MNVEECSPHQYQVCYKDEYNQVVEVGCEDEDHQVVMSDYALA